MQRTLSKIGEVLGITKMEDWYNKTGGDIKNAGGQLSIDFVYII